MSDDVAVLDPEAETGTEEKESRRKPDPEAAARREIVDEVCGRHRDDENPTPEQDIAAAQELFDHEMSFKATDFTAGVKPVFYEMRVIAYERKAAQAKRKADDARNPDETKQALKKLERLKAKAAKLAEQLADSGIDVSDLGNILNDLV